MGGFTASVQKLSETTVPVSTLLHVTLTGIIPERTNVQKVGHYSIKL